MKAILVIDNMPKSCNECILNIGGICGAADEPAYSIRCPLKPMPNEACEMLVKGLDAMEKMKAVEVKVVRRTE